jgi:hypothetical protein
MIGTAVNLPIKLYTRPIPISRPLCNPILLQYIAVCPSVFKAH